MRGFHKNDNRHRFHHRHGGTFRGAGWLIGIGFFMLWGNHWWPGILVIIGIGLVLSAFWKESERQEFPAPAQPASPPVQSNEFDPISSAPVKVVKPAQPTGQLPASCPRCGAPVRTSEVSWKGDRFAACAYCGSNMLMKHANQL